MWLSAQVTQLLRDYLGTYELAPVFTEEEVLHYLMPVEGVIETHVVEGKGSRIQKGTSPVCSGGQAQGLKLASQRSAKAAVSLAVSAGRVRILHGLHVTRACKQAGGAFLCAKKPADDESLV